MPATEASPSTAPAALKRLLHAGVAAQDPEELRLSKVLLNLGKVSMVALVLNYAFEAIMFPTIFSLSLRGLGNLTKSASSLLMMTPIGGCGFLLMGIITDSTGMVSMPFIIPFLGYFIVLLFASELSRKGKSNVLLL